MPHNEQVDYLDRVFKTAASDLSEELIPHVVRVHKALSALSSRRHLSLVLYAVAKLRDSTGELRELLEDGGVAPRRIQRTRLRAD